MFGLPAHPLLVHAPVVLIPILLAAIVALTVKPQWRAKGGPYLAAGAIGIFVLCVLAAGSGEKLEARVGEGPLVEEHAELGEQLRLIALFLALAVTAWVLATRAAVKNTALTAIVTPLAVASVALGALATVWDVRTGHAGAKAVWKETADRPAPAEGYREDGD